jgi:hypothetical protein
MLRASASLGALYLDRDTAIIITVKDGMMTLSVKDDKGEAHIEAQAQGEAITAVNGALPQASLESPCWYGGAKGQSERAKAKAEIEAKAPKQLGL